jgi:hypothetical protein
VDILSVVGEVEEECLMVALVLLRREPRLAAV